MVENDAKRDETGKGELSGCANSHELEDEADGSENEWEGGYIELPEKTLGERNDSDFSDEDTEGGLAWALPRDGKEIDPHVLAALPRPVRKTVIEEVR